MKDGNFFKYPSFPGNHPWQSCASKPDRVQLCKNAHAERQENKNPTDMKNFLLLFKKGTFHSYVYAKHKQCRKGKTVCMAFYSLPLRRKKETALNPGVHIFRTAQKWARSSIKLFHILISPNNISSHTFLRNIDIVLNTDPTSGISTSTHSRSRV